uniref:Protein kinase domain-containing protein n=1 Tax=Panagrolaimus sp. ES5 TaxID=591445 RepID=A0AC34FSB9_9BILA
MVTPFDSNTMKRMIKEAGCFGEKMQELMETYSKRSSRDPARFGPKIGEKIGEFKIVIRIGSGISDVYAAERDEGGLFAIKCSPKHVNLKGEYDIAKNCWQYSHLLKCLAYGEKEKYNFLIEELTGEDLHTFLINPEKDGSLKEVCKYLHEAMKGIQQFHGLKFMHQDIKLENFSICLANRSIVKLIDYGHSTSIGPHGICEKGKIGTIQFSSRDAMMHPEEQHRKSDLESWMYCLVYAAKETLLEPWCYTVGDDEVNPIILEQKQAVWNNPEKRLEFLTGLPVQFNEIMNIIDAVTPEKAIDYEAIYSSLQEVISRPTFTLIQGKQLDFCYALPFEPDEYQYFTTRNGTTAIKKGNIPYYNTHKTVKYWNGLVRSFKCKDCQRFYIYIDARKFEQDAKEGNVPPIEYTTDQVHPCKRIKRGKQSQQKL